MLEVFFLEVVYKSKYITSQNNNYFRNQIKYIWVSIIRLSFSNFLETLEVFVIRLKIGNTKIVHSFLMTKKNALTCSDRNIRIDTKHIFIEYHILYIQNRKNVQYYRITQLSTQPGLRLYFQLNKIHHHHQFIE